MAQVDRIWIKRAHRGAMDEVEEAEAVEGRGIRTSADQGGKRQVTLISTERWAELMKALGSEIDPSARRANILVSGLDFEDSRGKSLRIGEVEFRIAGETRPCERMDEALSGLQEAMRAHWGGGAYAEITKGGTIHVGDTVDWIA